MKLVIKRLPGTVGVSVPLFNLVASGYLDGLAASKTVYRTADGQYAVSVCERYGNDIIEPSPFAFRQKVLSLQNVYSDSGSMGKAAELSL